MPRWPFAAKPVRRARPGREVEAAGLLLPVSVTEYRRASRLTLRIAAGGKALKVTVPPRVSEAEIDSFISRNRTWIAARIARLPEPVALREGAIIPFLGKGRRIVHLDRRRGVIEPRSILGEDCLAVPGDPAHLSRRVADFLKREARRLLDEAVARHARTLGVRPRAIRIADTTSRWGSCSPSRTLSFSWRIVMAPPEVLDYLAAHETAHLVEMNHSPAFWRLVKRLCPDMARHKAWLVRHGPALHAVRL
jgi:predicted metal-dependent hydrolase